MSTLVGLSGIRISGIGYELGEELISNERMSDIVEKCVKRSLGKNELSEEEIKRYCTYPEWIFTRTGIKERYFAHPETATSDLATRAALKAIKHSGHDIQDCGFVLVATVTPDYPYSPPTAALGQHKIGIETRFLTGLRECFVTDNTSACSSFGAGLKIGHALIASGHHWFGVVIGADKMSTTVNFTDREFCILLGDAAAAVTLEAVPEKKSDFWLGPNSFFSWSDGSKGGNIIAEAGGSANPITYGMMEEMPANKFKRPDKLQQNGPAVFKDMGRLLYSVSSPEKTLIGCALKKAGLRMDEIDIVFFHQANLRIIEMAEDEMMKSGFRGKLFNTISEFGNTTSASVPLGMAIAHERGHLTRGQTILICAFGGGYTAGTAIFKWSI